MQHGGTVLCALLFTLCGCFQGGDTTQNQGGVDRQNHLQLNISQKQELVVETCHRALLRVGVGGGSFLPETIKLCEPSPLCEGEGGFILLGSHHVRSAPITVCPAVRETFPTLQRA